MINNKYLTKNSLEIVNPVVFYIILVCFSCTVHQFLIAINQDFSANNGILSFIYFSILYDETCNTIWFVNTLKKNNNNMLFDSSIPTPVLMPEIFD